MREVRWCKERVIIPGVAYKDYEKETAFQIYCADWLRKRFEVSQDGRYNFWHHSANERSNRKEGFTAKMMGQGKGFPDFVHMGMKIAVEFKVEGRLPSDDQKKWLVYFESIKWDTFICYTFEDFVLIVDNGVIK